MTSKLFASTKQTDVLAFGGRFGESRIDGSRRSKAKKKQPTCDSRQLQHVDTYRLPMHYCAEHFRIIEEGCVVLVAA